MKFIPGDIVSYVNKTTEYRIELNPQGKLHMRHRKHGGVYTVPFNADERLSRVGYDTTYRVPVENKEAFMSRTSRSDCSIQMRAWIEKRTPETKRMDTSGFDALNSAGKDDSVYRPGDAGYSNDSVDAMRYATHGVLQSSKTPFKMDMNDCERLVSDFHTAHPKVKNFINKLNGQGQGGRDMSININSLVAKVTDNIKDAELVTRFFGHELNEASIKDEYFVRDNYESLLEEAQEREEKRLAKLENSCA